MRQKRCRRIRTRSLFAGHLDGSVDGLEPEAAAARGLGDTRDHIYGKGATPGRRVAEGGAIEVGALVRGQHRLRGLAPPQAPLQQPHLLCKPQK